MSDPLAPKPFDHEQMVVVGVCGHWWQAPNEFDAMMIDCPEQLPHTFIEIDTEGTTRTCGRPPGHAFKPAVGQNVWTQFHPAAGCERKHEGLPSPKVADLDELADKVNDKLADYRTWLAGAVRSGRGLDALADLRDICTAAIDAIEERQ